MTVSRVRNVYVLSYNEEVNYRSIFYKGIYRQLPGGPHNMESTPLPGRFLPHANADSIFAVFRTFLCVSASPSAVKSYL
jgi:hypothetical protein